MFHFGIPFYTLLHLSLQGPVLSRVWVNQWSTLDEYRVGDMATLHCAIYSEKETIEDCYMKWVMREPNNPDIRIEMRESKLYADRVSVQSKDNTSTITIRKLGLNDTEPLCIIDCFIDGGLKRNIGQEGSLKIVELSDPDGPTDAASGSAAPSPHPHTPTNEPALFSTEEGEEESSPSLTWLRYFIFSVNIFTFLVPTVICCTIMCRSRGGLVDKYSPGRSDVCGAA